MPFSIERSNTPLRVAGASEAVALSADVRTIPRGAGTILGVEDEAQVRALVVEMLEMNGSSVLEAGNGADAVGLVERHTGPIDPVLTDVVMPRKGGLARRPVGEAPAADEGAVHVGAIRTTRSLPHGFAPGTALLQKPLPPAALAREIRTLLGVPLNRASVPEVSPPAWRPAAV